MASFLPYEMVWEIYQFLYLEQVLGCSCVSKTWARAARHHRPCEDLNRNLQYCVWMNDVPLAKEYIKYGADVNATVSDFDDVDTLIGLALRLHSCSTSSILGLLLAGGANITEQHLLRVVREDHWSLVVLMLKNVKMLKTSMSDSVTATLLRKACVYNLVELIVMLYSMDIPISATDILSNYMLSTAISYKAACAALRELVESVPYSMERVLMTIAVAHESKGVIKFLLNKCQATKKVICGYIEYARRINSVRVIKLLENWLEENECE